MKTALKVLLLSLVVNFYSFKISHAYLVDKIVGIANNDLILLSDIKKFRSVLELRKQLDPFFSLYDYSENQSFTDQQILDYLIREKLILQTITASDAEVDNQIQILLRDKGFTKEQIDEFLKPKGLSFADYKEQMKIGTSYNYFLEREIRGRVNISQEDELNYYRFVMKKGANLPEDYAFEMIFINPASYKNISFAKKTAEDALISLKKGESFAAVAKRVSDLPYQEQDSADSLSYISKESLAEPIKSILPTLSKGDFSNVLSSPKGFYIVHLIDVRSSETDDFKSKRDFIRDTLAKDEYKKQIPLWEARLRNNSYIKTNPI